MAQTITPTSSQQANGVCNFANGSWTGDGTTTTIKLGFKPRYVEILNATDVTLWMWMSTMAATNTVKQVTAGTTTLDTGSAIVDNGDGTITVSATAGASGKAMHFMAQG